MESKDDNRKHHLTSEKERRKGRHSSPTRSRSRSRERHRRDNGKPKVSHVSKNEHKEKSETGK